MVTTLIFVGRMGVDGVYELYGLIGLIVLQVDVQEIAPSYRPYPKPTQVDELNILRRLREWF
jgi:hypothetical protein